MKPYANIKNFYFVNAEFGTFLCHSLSCQVRENVRIKTAGSHAHIILVPYTETILQLKGSIKSPQIACTPHRHLLNHREHSTHSVRRWFRAYDALRKLWQAPPSGHT